MQIEPEPLMEESDLIISSVDESKVAIRIHYTLAVDLEEVQRKRQKHTRNGTGDWAEELRTQLSGDIFASSPSAKVSNFAKGSKYASTKILPRSQSKGRSRLRSRLGKNGREDEFKTFIKATHYVS